MGVELEEDLKRKMIELNLRAAQKALSPQTGYIHLSYDSDEKHDAIPLLENFCYALALLRSRLADSVVEGKAFLEKLLAFEVDGNFPVFLHEYPHCPERAFSLKLLPVFHWALADFRTALGELLSLRIELLIGRILSHGYKMHAQRPLARAAEFRLKRYFGESQLPDWHPASPEEWADALITLQMTGGQNEKLFEASLDKWHPGLCVYKGPQHQERSEPKATLFDLFLGHHHGVYSRRALEDRRIHLLASLVHPFGERKKEGLQTPYCHAIEPLASQPYAFYWGAPEQLHSFILDRRQSSCRIVEKENGWELFLQLPPCGQEQRQDVFECAFYVNLSAVHEILVQNAKATTFQCNESIQLFSSGLCLQATFFLERGEGQFFGHLSRANRPSQKGKDLKFETCDWQIALRTIRRSEDCCLRVYLEAVPASSASFDC